MDEAVYNQALRFLGYRFLSRKELFTKLKAKGYEVEPIEEVLERLTELDYLNDERLASQVAKLYMREAKYGKSYIRQKMAQRGLACDALLDSYNEEVAASALVEKKHSYKELDKLKIMRYLQNRGFSITTIHRIIANIEVDV